MDVKLDLDKGLESLYNKEEQQTSDSELEDQLDSAKPAVETLKPKLPLTSDQIEQNDAHAQAKSESDGEEEVLAPKESQEEAIEGEEEEEHADHSILHTKDHVPSNPI